MNMIKHNSLVSVINKAKELDLVNDLMVTDISLSFRVYEAKQTKDLHIYYFAQPNENYRNIYELVENL